MKTPMPPALGRALSYQHGDIQPVIVELWDALAGEGVARFLKHKVTLTDAQIKTLPTVPVVVLPAPGSNKVTIPLLSVVNTIPFVDVYTNIDAGAFTVVGYFGGQQYPLSRVDPGATATLFGSGVAFAFLGLTTLTPAQGFFSFGEVFGGSISINKTVELSIDNGASGNLTGGDPANSMSVTSYYVVLDL